MDNNVMVRLESLSEGKVILANEKAAGAFVFLQHDEAGHVYINGEMNSFYLINAVVDGMFNGNTDQAREILDIMDAMNDMDKGLGKVLDLMKKIVGDDKMAEYVAEAEAAAEAICESKKTES